MMGQIARYGIQAQKMARDMVKEFKEVNKENLEKVKASEEEAKIQSALQDAKSEVDQFRRDLKLITDEKTALTT